MCRVLVWIGAILRRNELCDRRDSFGMLCFLFRLPRSNPQYFRLKFQSASLKILPLDNHTS